MVRFMQAVSLVSIAVHGPIVLRQRFDVLGTLQNRRTNCIGQLYNFGWRGTTSRSDSSNGVESVIETCSMPAHFYVCRTFSAAEWKIVQNVLLLVRGAVSMTMPRRPLSAVSK